MRRLVLAEQPLCAECERQGVTAVASAVHHKRDLRDAPELALDRDNLEGLCESCHNRITAARQADGPTPRP